MRKRIFLISIIIFFIIIAIIIIGTKFFKSKEQSISQLEEKTMAEIETDIPNIELMGKEENISETLVEDKPSSEDVEQKDVEVTEDSTIDEVTTLATVQSNKVTETSNPKTTSTPTSTQISTTNNSKGNEKKQNEFTEVTIEEQSTPSQSEIQIPTEQTETEQTENKSVETTVTQTPTRCTNNNNHGMDVGNSGQWFSTKDEAIAYYNSKVSYWGNLWETFQIDNETYYKNCPSGYEVWTCMYCEKWTINFYYR